MSDRFLSWTDPERVASLLSRVTGPGSSPASPPRLDRRRPPPVAPVRAPEPVSPAFRPPPGGGILDRLDALVEWVPTLVSGAGVFVADDNGLTLVTRGVPDPIVAIVGSILPAIQSLRASISLEGHIGSLLLGEETLSWAEVSVARGTFCVGVVAKDAVAASVMQKVSEALTKTLADPAVPPASQAE